MAAPTISSITPSSGPPGTTVTILGTGLSKVLTVVLGGTSVAHTIVSDTAVTFVVPAGQAAGVDNVKITYDATVTDPGGFTVTGGTGGAPNPPTGLTAVLGGTQAAPTVVLNWVDSAGASSYDVYRNGALIATGVPG